jgi:hypothetical protein
VRLGELAAMESEGPYDVPNIVRETTIWPANLDDAGKSLSRRAAFVVNDQT